MKRFLICLFFASLMMAGCSLKDYKQLEFKSCNVRSVENLVYGRGTATADVCLEVGVANPTRSDFQLLSLYAVAYSAKGEKIATATTDEVTVLESWAHAEPKVSSISEIIKSLFISSAKS